VSDYKYNVGDLVHVNLAALDQLPPKNRKHVPDTFKSNLFTISKRRDDPSVQYFVPGYDWQGGDSWVDESFLSKWAGRGPLRLKVTIDREGSPESEVMATAAEVRESFEQAGELGVLDIIYTGDPVAELDSTG